MSWLEFQKQVADAKALLDDIENVAQLLVGGQCTDTEFVLMVMAKQAALNTNLAKSAEQLAQTYSTETAISLLNIRD